MEQSNEELQLRIRELEKEIAKLHTQIKKERYGLVWLDVPEGFERESENQIPVLEEVKDKAIKNDDGKPTHIIIEGDNYHALTCLNYTHKGKIDVIYIDPPYNTGSDGFTYKDKRFLKEFPDGSPVPKDHPLRHSYWLSFMSKRLELAKNLLSDKGVIFISIDDNEQANCKLLCDKIFGEENFVGCISRATGTTTGQDANKIGSSLDYCLAYAKSDNFILKGLPLSEKDAKRFKDIDEQGNYSILQLRKTGSGDRREDRPNMFYAVKAPDGSDVYPFGPTEYLSRWRVERKTFDELNQTGMIVWKQNNINNTIEIDGFKKSQWVPYVKYYFEGRTKQVSNLFSELDGNKKGTIEIKDIFRNKDLFSNPKPTQFLQILEQISSQKSSIILDFFAGSGTTLHATMKLNAEDGGNRQCILVQQKEGDKNICESVTYERNKRVINGYTNAKGEQIPGLGNSLKYYKTAFVGKHPAKSASDDDKIQLSLRAGCLLALAENTLEEIETTSCFQIFSDGNRHFTGVYFTGKAAEIPTFAQKLETLRDENRRNKISAYFFCWGDSEQFEDEFTSLERISLKPIPKPILDIYQSINN